MSSCYGVYQTVHRRFQTLVQEGIFEKPLLAVAQDVHERGDLDLIECFIDGTFMLFKRGGIVGTNPFDEKDPIAQSMGENIEDTNVAGKLSGYLGGYSKSEESLFGIISHLINNCCTFIDKV